MLRSRDAVPDAIDHLLVSLPNAVATHRVRAHLAAAGIGSARSEMGLKVRLGGLDWRVLLESIGTALSPAEAHDTRVAVMRISDDPDAMHRAIFRAQSIERLLTHLRDEWLDEVLDDGEIRIHLQPLIQYPPGRVHGYECLMRGVDPDGMLIPPVKMFEAARTRNRLSVLDQRCRSAAIRAAGALAGTGVNVFINLLPSAILNPRRTLMQTMDELAAAGLRPEQVCFEVVETDRIQDHRELLNILRYYRKAGFKVAMDDVGAGYSSLLSLSKLRPDYIKLDGELVRRAAVSALEAKMVADLAETARENGIITIAEGIETPAEFRVAIACGIRITQGYFHARPAPEPLIPEQIGRIVSQLEHAAKGAGRIRQTA